MRMFLASLALVFSIGLLFTAGGCAGSDTVTAESIRRRPTPELFSLAMTRGERLNMIARTNDTNLAQIPDDWDRFWLVDRPVWLSIYPIP